VAVSGGAPLAAEIAETFLSLGVTVIQGYGLTETSPVVSANTPDDNLPTSVGRPLPGVEVRIGAAEELLVRCPSVMLGYWNQPKATAEAIDAEGWLHTGDQARIEDRRIFLTGRIKEIIVLANGEKAPPSDMETAIAMDSLINQVVIVGEGKPFLAALVTLDPDAYAKLAGMEHDLSGDLGRDRDQSRLEEILLHRIAERLLGFPGYAAIRRLAVVEKPWNIENGMMTPTMKLKRERILEAHREDIDRLYRDHR
jgi:long-chain acyl-CoA synthetase